MIPFLLFKDCLPVGFDLYSLSAWTLGAMPHAFYDAILRRAPVIHEVPFLSVSQQNIAVNVYCVMLILTMWTWEAYLISVFVVQVTDTCSVCILMTSCLDMTNSVWSHTWLILFDWQTREKMIFRLRKPLLLCIFAALLIKKTLISISQC